MAGNYGVRERRLACGMTQADLATKAGVSRQLVAAVEAGRHSPAVDAALGIARALGTSVEGLFAPQNTPITAALGGTLRPGMLLRLGRVDTRLVAAELPDHATRGSVWATPDAVVEEGGVRVLPAASPAGFVVAGCDPVLGVLEALLAGLGPSSLLAVPAPTGRALTAMTEGNVHAAVVHGRSGFLPPAPTSVVRWHLARWQVGLAYTTRKRPPTLASLLRGAGPIVQQDAAAVSQQALVRATRSAGLKLPAGPVATGHLDAARRANETGSAAVTIAAAAQAFKLDFLALEEHVVELWVDARWLGHPGLTALGEALVAPAFLQRVALFGGYDLTGCGDRIEAA
ncbi:MAG: helix-turn-helix domain-containing protein [Acidimicrobiales bacterium]